MTPEELRDSLTKPAAAPSEDLSDVRFVTRVTIGSLERPNSEEQMEQQIALLNRCLQSSPRGRIVGKDVAVLLVGSGQSQLTMQVTTYHVGFPRRPYWLKDEPPAS